MEITILVGFVSFGLGLILSRFIFRQVNKMEEKND